MPLASAQTEYVYLDGAPIAAVKGGSLSYIETDHLGTPRVVADPATNAARWAWNFFGDTFGAEAPDPSPGGAAAYTLNLRFPGQYYDAETNLNYNYFRDYEAAAGRYVESDPIGLRGGLGTFPYVSSSPLNLVDPKGLDFWVEGGTSDQGGGTFHRKLCVGSPEGDAFCVSYSCAGEPPCLFGAPGEYYEDEVRGGVIDPDTYRISNPHVDAEIKLNLQGYIDQSGHGMYWLIGRNCRDFSYSKWWELNTHYQNRSAKPPVKTSR